MPTVYNARDAGNYERLMGRWSRRLAPLFIEHAGVADGEEVLEIGCGTGSLTFALTETGGVARLPGVLWRRRFRPRIVDAGAALGGTAARADGRRNAPGDPAGRRCRRGFLG